MEQRELALRREVKIKDVTHVFKGEEIAGITNLGIVVVKNSSLRYLYPWHRVSEFTYDFNDVGARKFIQGY